MQYCPESRFWRNCPSGTRYHWEPYYASGKMEIARGLHVNELEPSDSMRDILYTCMLCSSCQEQCYDCLLYTSDAADDLLCVDLGGRRIIKKKKTPTIPRASIESSLHHTQYTTNATQVLTNHYIHDHPHTNITITPPTATHPRHHHAT